MIPTRDPEHRVWGFLLFKMASTWENSWSVVTGFSESSGCQRFSLSRWLTTTQFQILSWLCCYFSEGKERTNVGDSQWAYRMLEWLGCSYIISIPKAFTLSVSLCPLNLGLKPFHYLDITVSLTAELSVGSEIDYIFFSMSQLLFFTSAGSHNFTDGKHMFIGT